MTTELETTFAIGEEVRIKTYDRKPKYWVSKMTKYMGQTVKVKDIIFRMKKSYAGNKVRIVIIKIQEDQSEVPNGWDWSPFNFENI